MARILIAEDDLHIGRVIGLWLKRHGHTIVTAYDGQKALEMIRSDPPDLIVTDVNMPGMDGLDMIEAVRAEKLVPHTAIVLTSRCDQQEIEARASTLGAIVHPKPFSPQQLVQAVEEALRTSLVEAADAINTD
jgi:DNA-binding response OmpR family regulator